MVLGGAADLPGRAMLPALLLGRYEEKAPGGDIGKVLAGLANQRDAALNLS
jgi:hypothetical protein